MTDNAATKPTFSCPWCSAELPASGMETCTSCGATLTGEADAPGLTTFDGIALDRALRGASTQRRSRLLAWITGDDSELTDPSPAAPGSLAPPPPEVRREMLRMELEAEVADLQAEVVALAAEAREAGDDEDRQRLEAVADNAAEIRAEVAATPPAEGFVDVDAEEPGHAGRVDATVALPRAPAPDAGDPGARPAS